MGVTKRKIDVDVGVDNDTACYENRISELSQSQDETEVRHRTAQERGNTADRQATPRGSGAKRKTRESANADDRQGASTNTKVKPKEATMDPKEEGRLAEAVERLSKEVTEGNSRVEKKLDRVETRIDRVETRIDRVETRIHGVDQRINDVENNFNNKFWSAVKWVGVVTGAIIVACGFVISTLIGVVWMFIDK